MPTTYALLGATGSTGKAIIRSLLKQSPEDLTLKVFVRSSSKLHNAFPDLDNNTSFKTEIIEGTPDNHLALQKCLQDAEVIFACIATNEATAGMSLAYDVAGAIINALKHNKEKSASTYKTPTILQLRSASVNTNLKPSEPFVSRHMAGFCFYHIYADIERACELFIRSAEETPGLLKYIWVDPPSIHDSEGTTATGHRLLLGNDTKQEPALMYADLGNAMCEVAERRVELEGQEVGVSATGKVNETWGVLMGYMFSGFKSRVWG